MNVGTFPEQASPRLAISVFFVFVVPSLQRAANIAAGRTSDVLRHNAVLSGLYTLVCWKSYVVSYWRSPSAQPSTKTK